MMTKTNFSIVHFCVFALAPAFLSGQPSPVRELQSTDSALLQTASKPASFLLTSLDRALQKNDSFDTQINLVLLQYGIPESDKRPVWDVALLLNKALVSIDAETSMALQDARSRRLPNIAALKAAALSRREAILSHHTLLLLRQLSPGALQALAQADRVNKILQGEGARGLHTVTNIPSKPIKLEMPKTQQIR